MGLRTRFSVQREVFPPPCPFIAPGRFFSHEERGRKIRQGSEMDTGRKEKTLQKNRKKEYEKQAHFRNEGQKVLYSRVVYNEGLGLFENRFLKY